LFDYEIKHLFSSKRASYCLDTGSHSVALGHRGSEVERAAFGPLGPIRSMGAQGLEGGRPTDLGGASWVAASATPDMLSEDPTRHCDPQYWSPGGTATPGHV